MLRGSLVAIVTPMTADGSLDLPAWDRLLDFHLREGTEGVVIGGTTGESPTLSVEEIEELTRRAVDRCAGKLKVIAGAGTHATSSTVARARVLSRLGVDGIMLVTPYYNKPPQEGLYRHFMAAADASAAPVILYNVPGRTAVDLLPATVARLARHPRITAIKDASASLGRLRELLAACPADFSVLSGDDATAIEWLGAGAQGVISVTANVAPARMLQACDAALRKDMTSARAIDAELQLLHKTLFVESSPIPVKWAVARMGLIGYGIRLPLVELSPGQHDAVLCAMRAAGHPARGPGSVRLISATALLIAAGFLSGCHLHHLFHGFEPDCHKPQEYQRAVQLAPLKVPAGMDSPNTQGALVIPTVGLTPPPPGAHEACLDTPPRYKPAPANKAGTPSS